MKFKAVIKPPEDHENYGRIWGERIIVTIEIEGTPFPWCEPWKGWQIEEVVEEDP